ncbi:MAG: hypothetical protein KDC98_16670 [Planctomycetes bacterium]|nr:hypothetical protein [Planctomycetota bacterium]
MRTTIPASILLFSSFAAAQWSQALPASNPSARIEPQMAYNGVNTVLFGGADVAGFPPTNFADTWTWDGTNWTPQSPATSPSGRYFGGMAHDVIRNVTVLYGGLSATFFGASYKDDTWEYDGSTWTQVPTANSPGGYIGNPGVGEVSMAYDLVGQRIVMFGGELFQGIVPAPNLTFEYDGTNWTQTSPSTAPERRSQASMCTASSLGGVLLFGGTNFNNPPGPFGEILWNDTWVYSAATDTWTQLHPSGPLPPERAGASLLFDVNSGLYVLHGGYTYVANAISPLADTWVFDGTAWTDVTASFGSPTAPRVRFASAEGPNGCHVLFGGAPAVFGTPYADTWLHCSSAAANAYGAGCAGSNGVPMLMPANLPQIGTTYFLDASNLASAATLAFLTTGFSATTSVLGPLPFDLQPYGLGAGCSLLTSAQATSLFAVATGSGSSSLALPSVSAFVGLEMFHQVGSLDAGAAGGMAVSNGVRTLIGN